MALPIRRLSVAGKILYDKVSGATFLLDSCRRPQLLRPAPYDMRRQECKPQEPCLLRVYDGFEKA